MDKRVIIREADLSLELHQQDVLEMTQAYAMDEMGNHSALPPDVVQRLIPGLRSLPTTMIFLAYSDEKAVGIATCFLGFSTFLGRPIINIHDLGVLSAYRGRGIGRQLLAAVEKAAYARGCGKITFEVLEDNTRARKIYERAGFHQATAGMNRSGMLFYSKHLNVKSE